jgi:hypothetical protein
MADPKDNTVSADQYTANKGPFDYFDQSVSFGGTEMKFTPTVTNAPTVDYIKAGRDANYVPPGLESQNLFKSNKLTNFSNMGRTGFAKSKSKYKDFDDMMKQHNLGDRSGSSSLSQGTAGSLMGGYAGLALTALGLGGKKTGETPSGKPVGMNTPILSHALMKSHWDNYALTEAKFTEADNALQKGNEVIHGHQYFGDFDSSDALNATKNFHKSNSTGFYANFGTQQISRNPTKWHYDGGLHNFGPNAHNSFKTIEALGKGLDPSGFRLDGKNEDNRGAVSNANGMAGITEDGYYVYANFGSSFGYTKTTLKGLGGEGSESWAMAKDLGVDVDVMVKAMETARSGSKTFSQALLELTGKAIATDAKGTTEGTSSFGTKFDATFTKIGDTLTALSETPRNILNTIQGAMTTASQKFDAGVKKGAETVFSTDVGQKIGKGAIALDDTIQNKVQNIENQLSTVDLFNTQKKEEPNRQAGAGTKVTSDLKAVETARDKSTMDYSIRRGYGFNQGGAVQSGYYGYQDGGEINMQEMGFVNGKTPDQVTDAQSVADTEATQAEEGDFVINAPAVEIVGVDNLIQLMSEALQRAEQEGARIVDIPPTTEPEQMVDIFVSEGEFIVPRELIPFVEGGIELLEQINEAGKGEVAERVEESPMQGQPMEQQQPVQEFSLASPEKRNAISAAKFQNEMQELPI